MIDHLALPEILAAFPAQFDATSALHQFARLHRPPGPAADEAGALILGTYVRGTKTFQASVRLAGLGYGAQAGMLNRSLFEDMVVAHWVRLNPVEAPPMFERHRTHTLDQLRATYRKHGREHDVTAWPELTGEERAKLHGEYERTRHWTRRSLYKLVKEVEHEWLDEHSDRRMLWQVFDISHRFNNLILHHSFYGFRLAFEETLDGVRLDVGHSKTHVHAALLVAWFSYGHLVSLVVDGDSLAELNALFVEHLPAFAKIRSVPVDELPPGKAESIHGE